MNFSRNHPCPEETQYLQMRQIGQDYKWKIHWSRSFGRDSYPTLPVITLKTNFAIFFLFSFQSIPGVSRGLLMVLCSQITMNGLWRTIWTARDKTRINCLESKCLTMYYSLDLFCIFSRRASKTLSSFTQSFISFLFFPKRNGPIPVLGTSRLARRYTSYQEKLCVIVIQSTALESVGSNPSLASQD